jgi:hypothetical protein
VAFTNVSEITGKLWNEMTKVEQVAHQIGRDAPITASSDPAVIAAARTYLSNKFGTDDADAQVFTTIQENALERITEEQGTNNEAYDLATAALDNTSSRVPTAEEFAAMSPDQIAAYISNLDWTAMEGEKQRANRAMMDEATAGLTDPDEIWAALSRVDLQTTRPGSIDFGDYVPNGHDPKFDYFFEKSGYDINATPVEGSEGGHFTVGVPDGLGSGDNLELYYEYLIGSGRLGTAGDGREFNKRGFDSNGNLIIDTNSLENSQSLGSVIFESAVTGIIAGGLGVATGGASTVLSLTGNSPLPDDVNGGGGLDWWSIGSNIIQDVATSGGGGGATNTLPTGSTADTNTTPSDPYSDYFNPYYGLDMNNPNDGSLTRDSEYAPPTTTTNPDTTTPDYADLYSGYYNSIMQDPTNPTGGGWDAPGMPDWETTGGDADWLPKFDILWGVMGDGIGIPIPGLPFPIPATINVDKLMEILKDPGAWVDGMIDSAGNVIGDITDWVTGGPETSEVDPETGDVTTTNSDTGEVTVTSPVSGETTTTTTDPETGETTTTVGDTPDPKEVTQQGGWLDSGWDWFKGLFGEGGEGGEGGTTQNPDTSGKGATQQGSVWATPPFNPYDDDPDYIPDMTDPDVPDGDNIDWGAVAAGVIGASVIGGVLTDPNDGGSNKGNTQQGDIFGTPPLIPDDVDPNDPNDPNDPPVTPPVIPDDVDPNDPPVTPPVIPDDIDPNVPTPPVTPPVDPSDPGFEPPFTPPLTPEEDDDTGGGNDWEDSWTTSGLGERFARENPLTAQERQQQLNYNNVMMRTDNFEVGRVTMNEKMTTNSMYRSGGAGYGSTASMAALNDENQRNSDATGKSQGTLMGALNQEEMARQQEVFDVVNGNTRSLGLQSNQLSGMALENERAYAIAKRDRDDERRRSLGNIGLFGLAMWNEYGRDKDEEET